MSTLVVLVVLGSALVHAGWNALLKGRRAKDGTANDPLPTSAGLSLAWALVGTPLLFVVDVPPRSVWGLLALSVVVHTTYFALLVAAYRRADLSFVYPIARGLPPLFITMLAWFFVDERPTPFTGAGVGLIAFGVIGVGLIGQTRKRQPGDHEPDGATPGSRRRALPWTLAVAAGTTTYVMLDGVGARETGAVSYSVWLTCLQGWLFGIGAGVVGGAPVRRVMWQRRWLGLGAGLLSAGGYMAALWAMTEAPIAPVAALRETSVLFAALLGAVVLKEKLAGRRIVAALFVVAGVVLVRMS